MSILPIPSFLDDIKNKGLRKAVYEGVDEVVTRVTTGDEHSRPTGSPTW